MDYSYKDKSNNRLTSMPLFCDRSSQPALLEVTYTTGRLQGQTTLKAIIRNIAIIKGHNSDES